jgi:hypothetical protein
MKIRRSIYWFAAIAVVLIAVLLWHGKNTLETPLATPAETNALPSVAGRAVAQPTNAINRPRLAQAASNTATVRNQPRPQPGQGATDGKVALLKEILNGNDADIVFYGHLEDQFSNGVAGAEVNFSIQYEDATDRGVRRGQVVSDGNGLFTISGYTGANLGIMPKKPGYALATTGTSFRYSQISPRFFVPDANNPTVIQMRKLQGAEPLVTINKAYKLPYTDAPIFFDFVTGNVVPNGGDLEVIITRTPGPITQRNHGDWSINLMAVNGGIMESDPQAAQVAFEAPANGYQNNYLVQMNHDDPHWFDNIQKEFFLSSRNGQVYSKFSLNFGINGDPNGPMWFQFKGAANANGSRNWEGDANTMKP